MDPDPPQRGFSAVVDPTDESSGPLAVALPYESRLQLRTSPSETAMVECVALAFREELMHGARQGLGLTRARALLRRRGVRTLFDYLRGDQSAPETAASLHEIESASARLHDRTLPFVETVDKHLTQQVLQDEAFINRIGKRFASTYAEAANYANALRRQRERIAADIDRYDPEVHRALEDLTATHGRTVAEAVVDAAFDVDFAMAPVSIDGVPTRPVEEVDLAGRFEHAVDLVEDGAGTDPAALSGRLRREHENHSNADSRLDDVDVPLLDVPRRLSTDATTTKQALAGMELAPSPITHMLAGAFRVTGAVGGAVYQFADGEWCWLVNPYVADRSVGTPRASTYTELWERRTLGSLLLRRLQPTGGHQSIDCPLCVRSPVACGGSTCAFDDVIHRARDLREPLHDAWPN